MTIARIACVVPFCRRTRAAEKIAPDSEWLCCDHWRLVDHRRRRLYARATRHKLEARGWLWDRLKRQAIERAVGIG